MLIKFNREIKFIKNGELVISEEIKNKIDVCWRYFIKTHEDFWNGEI